MNEEENKTEKQADVNSNITSKTKIVLVVTILIVAICIVVALMFSKPKNVAAITPVASQPAFDYSVLEKAVAANPNSDNIIRLTAAYINGNMPAKTFPYLKALIKKEPNNAGAYNNLGVANIMLKNYMQGIEACTKAIKLDTTFQLAKNNLKWGIAERDKVLSAITLLNNIQADKQDKAFFIQLGFDYFEVGNYDQSIIIWQQGLQKFPDGSAIFYNNIGSALVLQKKYNEAITNFNKVLSIDPDNQLAKNNIAWAQAEAAEK